MSTETFQSRRMKEVESDLARTKDELDCVDGAIARFRAAHMVFGSGGGFAWRTGIADRDRLERELRALESKRAELCAAHSNLLAARAELV